MRKILIVGAAIAALAALALPAEAQTLPVKALPSTANPCQVATASTPLSCTGGYVGGGIGGEGSNADIIGSGIAGSVFAGGVTPWLDAGYQYVNGNWLLAGELDLGYGIGSAATINGTGTNFNGLRTEILFKAGGNISALFGNQVPITVPASLQQALLGLYAGEGVAWWQLPGTFATGNVSAVGALFDFGPHLFGDLRYEFTNFSGAKFAGTTLNNDQSVKFMLDYKF
jgi:hypothetical protein